MKPTPTGDAAHPRRDLDFVDTFEDDTDQGSVVGSRGRAGATRHGVDAEGVIGIDHGALRFRPMIHQGWGRSLIAYGPYTRRNGLVFAAMLLNGHNTSQSEPLPEPLASRLLRWLQGHGDRRFGLVRRLMQWLRYRRKRYMLHKIRAWRRMASGQVEPLDENLAVGWFPSPHPGDPNQGSNVFVMHAALGDNGELWLRSGSAMVSAAHGIQNVPMCYVTILRDTGAAYYLASVPGANGAAPYPRFRPYGIDAAATDPEVYAGVHQAALGQIGFRTDTRVYGAQVEHVESLSGWFGTAHVADHLTGTGELGEDAVHAREWSIASGGFVKESDGARPTADSSTAVVHLDRPTGLLHALCSARGAEGTVGLVWRYADVRNHYRLEVGRGVARLVQVVAGSTDELASSPIDHDLRTPTSVQVVDDGRTARVVIDGRSIFAEAVGIDHLATALGVGIFATGDVRLRDFEAHPSEVDLGDVVRLPPPWFEHGDEIVVGDHFDGPAGELEGRITTTGAARWRRAYGDGRMRLTGRGDVVVDASIDRPNPGNTAYVVAWDHPEFVDVAVDVTPPGGAFGEGHRGRGGLVLWDDRDNFVMISMYVDDSYDGASIAYFSHLDGFEDIYDAVWSMVGKKIYWGATHRLRVVSDGNHLMTFIDDEPVLYRSVTDLYSDRGPLRINAVGLAVNWEWGDDTGTTFDHFTARARSAPT